MAREGEKVAIKIVGSNQDEANNSFGRTFGLDDELVSYITKESIDVLKEHHRHDLTTKDWAVLRALKSMFKIP